MCGSRKREFTLKNVYWIDQIHRFNNDNQPFYGLVYGKVGFMRDGKCNCGEWPWKLSLAIN